MEVPPKTAAYWDAELTRAFQNMALFRRHGHHDLADAENQKCVEAWNKMRELAKRKA